MWPAHIQGKAHKQNVLDLKAMKSTSSSTSDGEPPAKMARGLQPANPQKKKQQAVPSRAFSHLILHDSGSAAWFF